MSQSQVHDLLDRWAAAERTGDAETLDALLAADFKAIGPLGFILDKTGWLQRYRSGDLVNEEFEIDEVDARSYGSTAVVNAVQHQKAAHRGRSFPGNFRITVVAVESGGGWQIVNIQLSQLVDPRQQQQ